MHGEKQYGGKRRIVLFKVDSVGENLSGDEAMDFKNEFLGLASATWTGVWPEDVVARLESCPDVKAPSRFVAPMPEGIVFVLYDRHEVRRAVISWEDIESVDFETEGAWANEGNMSGFDRIGTRSMLIGLWGSQYFCAYGEWLQMASLSESFFEVEFQRHRRQDKCYFDDKDNLSCERYLNLVKDVKQGKEIVAALNLLLPDLDTEYGDTPSLLKAATEFYL